MVLDPTCLALCCRGAGCLIDVGTYLPGTLLQAVQAVAEHTCRAVLKGCRLFKWSQNLLAGHCAAGVQAV